MNVTVNKFVEALRPYFLTTRGNNTVGGTISPDVAGTRDIGTIEKPFRRVYATELIGGSVILDDQPNYVHISSPRTITARHTFAPSSTISPFILGANAQGQTVVGLKADQLNKSVIAGSGMSGGGALSADVTVTLGTPSSLTSTSTNSASGTTHTHAIDATIARSARNITAGTGLTGGGDLTSDRTINVGQGDGILLGVDTVGIALSATSGLELSGTSPSKTLQLADTIAGDGLTIASKILAVGAGAGLTVSADSVALTTPGSLSATSTNSSTGSHTHAIDSTIARSAITITGGSGFAVGSGGDLTGNRTLTLGTPSALSATTTDAVTTNSHTHSISTGAATTLSVSTTNTTGTGSALARADHTHAITTSSNPGATAAILASTAAGGLTLVDLTATSLSASRLVASDANDKLVSVGNLASWIAGTSNRVSVADDGDGTITLSAPQDIHTTATPTFSGVIASWLRPTADSTTAVQLRTSAGASVLNVDTTNSRIGIGNTPSYKLDVSGDVRLTGTLYVDSGIVDLGTDYFQEGVTYLELKGTKPLYLNQTIQSTSWNITTAGAATMSSVITPSVYATTGAALTLGAGTDIILSPTSSVVKTATGVSLQSSSFASQTTGWRVTNAGEADFRYLFTDELHAKSFIADLEQALAGGQIIAKSVAMVATAFTLPAAGVAGTLRVRDLPSAPNMAVFQAGDFVGLRQFSRAAGALTIGWAWGTVTAYVDGTGADEGTQAWTFTRHATTPGSATGTIPADAIVLDFGVSGNGFYEVNAIDGTYGANSPYAQVVTWVTHPATQTVRSRMGNLRGIFSVADEFGLYAGSGTSVTDRYIRASNTALELRNVPVALYDGANNTMLLSAGATNNSPFLALGATIPTGPLAQDGIWMGKNGSNYEFRVGSITTGALSNGIYWNGSALLVGNSTAENIYADGSTLEFRNGSEIQGSLSATTWTLGKTGASENNVIVTPASISLRRGTTAYATLTGTDFQLGTVENVYITPTALQFRDGSTVYAQLDGGSLTLGNTSNEHVLVDTTGVLLKDNTTVYAQFAATTTVGVTSAEHVSISGTSVQIKDGSSVYTDLTGGALTLGLVSGGEYISINGTDGLRFYSNATLLGQWTAAGGVVIGPVANSTSRIELTAGSVSIINRNSSGVDATAISLTSAGNATFTGTVAATAGSIGGWAIDTNGIKKDTGVAATSAGMMPADFPFYAGATYINRASAPFRVTPAGAMTATSGMVGGWSLGSTSLTAGSGATTVGLDSGGTNPAIYAGSATSASAPFRVTNTGSMYATTGTIAGDFTVSGSGKLSASGGGIVLTSTGINVGVYANIDQSATPPDTSKAITWYADPSTPGTVMARQYVSESSAGYPYWSVAVDPVGNGPRMTLWDAVGNKFLWFDNITSVVGLPGVDWFVGGISPITAHFDVSANTAFWLESGSEFIAWTHLKAGTSNTYDLGESGVKWRKLYVGEVIADTVSGGTSLGGNTWQRADAGDMYINSFADSVSRTLYIANPGTGSMNLDVEGNIVVGGTVDGVDVADFKSTYDSHNHDSRYYTETELQTSGSATVHWGNLSNKPSTFAPSAHAYDDDVHTGSLSWAKVSKTGSNLNEIETRSHTVLSDIGTNTHANIDTHIGTADIHVAHSGVDFTAGAGLTGGGTIAASRSFAVGAGLGITVNDNDVALASSVAGNGLTYTTGVLAVGVSGLGLSVGADAVTLTSSSNPGAAAAILASNASGYLQLTRLGIGVAPVAAIGLAASTAAVGGIDFGGDVNLYRSAANVLKTDDLFNAAGGLQKNGIDAIAYDDLVEFAEPWQAKRIVMPELFNILHRADSRFAVSQTGFATFSANTLFYNLENTANKINAGSTGIITIDFTAKGEYGATGIVYPQGYIYIHCYKSGSPYNQPQTVSGRFQDKDGVWWNLTAPTWIAPNIWRLTVPGNNYMKILELSIVALPDDSTFIWSIEYYPFRPTGLFMTFPNKFQAERIYSDWTWRDSSNIEKAKIAATTGAISGMSLTANDLANSRLVASDANKKLTSVSDLTSWIGGTANRVTVASDGDGTVTLSGPQDIHTSATPTFAGLIAPWLRPAADSTTALQLRNASGTAILTVDTTNSRVGIGTTSPSELLDVSAGSGYGSFVLTSGSLQRLKIGYLADRVQNVTPAQIWVNSLGYLGLSARTNYASGIYFYTTPPETPTTSIERVRISPSGNVGIGTNAPSYKLDVSGDVRLTGTLYADGGIVDFGATYFQEDATYLQLKGTKPFLLNQTVQAASWNITTAGAATLTDAITPSVRAGASTELVLGAGADIQLNPTGVVKLASGKLVRSSAFTSGFAGSGWQIDDGVLTASKVSAEFDDLTIRGRLRVYELLVQQIRATNGSVFVSSTGKAKTVTGGPTSFTITTDSADNHGFLVGDLIRAQRFTGTGVYQCDMQVTAVANLYTFTATLIAGTAPVSGYEFVRLGSTSDASRRGSIYLTADDSGAPFIDVVDGINTHAAWNSRTADAGVKVRLGRITGITGTANEYGLWAGSGTGNTAQSLIASSQGVTLNNVPLNFRAGSSTVVMALSPGAGNASPSIALGAALPTGPLAGDGIWLGKDGSDYELRVGTVLAGALVKGLHWDGANLVWKATNTSLDASGNLVATNATLSGAITATSGSITGNFTVGAELRVHTDGSIYSGAAATWQSAGYQLQYNGGTPRMYVGDGGVTASDKYFLWDGTNLEWRGANTSLTAAGAFTATNATITGVVTANTGYIGGASGWTIATGAITSNNIGLYSGAANSVARIEVGAGSTYAGINSAADAAHIAFWAGSTYANRATAAFRVTAGGALYANSANITGTIDAADGYLGNMTVDGTLLVSTGGVLRSGMTGYATGTGWYMDYNSGGSPRMSIGTGSAGTLTSGLAWSGSSLSIIGNAIIGPGTGFVTTAKAHWKFDAPQTNRYRVNLNSHLGAYPTSITGTYRGDDGKFGGGLQLRPAGTNYINNPSFEVNTTDYWTWSNSPTVARVGGGYSGGYCASMTTGATADPYMYCSNLVGGPAYAIGQVWVFSAYVKAGNAGAVGKTVRVVIRENANNSYRTDANFTLTADWQRISVTHTLATAATQLNHWLALLSSAGSGDVLLIDAVQMELDQLTGYVDGSMEGAAWGGTAHNSISTQATASVIVYSKALLPATPTEGTAMLWVKPISGTAGHTYNNYLRYSGASGHIIIRTTIGAANWQVYWGGSVTAGGTLTYGSWQHVAVTRKAGTTTLYVNGVQAGTVAGTELVFHATSGFYLGTLSATEPANGVIDEVAILDRALTADEIAQVYRSGQPLTVPTSANELAVSGGGLSAVRINSLGITALDDIGNESFALANGALTWGTRYSGGSALASGDLVLGDPDQFHLMYDASAASLTIGKPTEEHIVIDGSGIKIKNSTTAYLTLDGGSASFTGAIDATSGYLGSLTIDGTLSMATGGVIKSGATAYNSGTGFWLEHNSGTPRLFIGNSAGNKLTWDGTNLSITGAITATSGSFTGAITASSGSITGALTMGASGAITATNTRLDSTGIVVESPTDSWIADGYRFKSGTNYHSGLWAQSGAGGTGYTSVSLRSNAQSNGTIVSTNTNSWLELATYSSGTGQSQVDIRSRYGAADSQIVVYSGSTGRTILLYSDVFQFNNNTVWHAGNDGAGSGLDADTLDTYSEAAFGRLARASTWSTLQTFSAGLTVSAGALTGVSATFSSTFNATGAATLGSTLSVTGLITATGGVNAAAAYQRSGTAGYIFVPLYVASLTDTGAVVWDGTINKAAPSTSIFDMQAAANGSVPAAAKAVVLHASANWTAANQGYYMLVRKRGSAENVLVVRSAVANINNDRVGIVPLDATNSDVEVAVAGAQANACELRLIGYFI